MSDEKSGIKPIIKRMKRFKGLSKSECMQKCSESEACKVYNFVEKNKMCTLMKIALIKNKNSRGVTGIIPSRTASKIST